LRPSSAEIGESTVVRVSSTGNCMTGKRILARQDSRTIVRQLVVTPFALAISAYLTASVHQLPDCLPIAWLGLVPLFWLLRTMKPAGALIAGAFWGLCLAFVWHSYVQTVPFEPDLSTLAIIAAPAAYAALAAGYTRRFGFSPLALAVGWIGLELSLTACLPRGGILMTGFEGNPILRYIANLLGCGFVALVMSYVSALLTKIGEALYILISAKRSRVVVPVCTCHLESKRILHPPSHRPKPSSPRAPPVAAPMWMFCIGLVAKPIKSE